MENKNKDLVSVIIPIYNVDNYIDECINSIVNQTYRNLEIILIDDGSQDTSPKKCDEWAGKDDRIRVIHKKNGGVSDARNTGIECATGDYLVFIDSDDLINVHMIEILYNSLLKTDTDISMCRLKVFRGDSTNINIYENVNDFESVIYDDTNKFDNLFNTQIGEMVFPSNKLYKKKIFNDLRYPIGKYHEDVFMTHHILDKANTVVLNNIVLYHYRRREGSITSKFDFKRLDEVEGMKERKNFFCSKYKNTKYAGLSIISYGDKIIRTYCLLKYNNAEGDYSKSLKFLKHEYNKNFKEMIMVPESLSRKLKHIFFLVLPKLYYVLMIDKYTT